MTIDECSCPASSAYTSLVAERHRLVEEVGRLTKERDAARAAFAQLRWDVDGYDMTFEHARWIGEQQPGTFDEWLAKYENEDWPTWGTTLTEAKGTR